MKITTKNKVTRILPECDLVASQVEELRDGILNRLKKKPAIERVIFDVNGVQVVDSLGVNLIIGTFRQCDSQSIPFEIVNANEKFVKISDFFQFEDFFKVTPLDKTT